MKSKMQQQLLLILSFCIQGHQSAWAEETLPTVLPPEQRQQIQTVGQAVLAAKRHAEPDEQALAVRAQIETVRKHLEALSKPTGIVQPVTAMPPAASSAAANKHAEKQDWKQSQAARQQRLEASLATLEELRVSEIVKRNPPQTKWWQRLKAKVMREQEPSDTARQTHIATPVSDAALERIATLQDEIRTALALPEEERYERLRTLSKRMKFERQFPDVPVRTSDGKQPDARQTDGTPTMTTRTAHRRQFQ
ncbi:MAG: hypothetical protein KJ725_15820 [Gammaproteobacteria bacterium]|nr:hypothetical protein [Gammaproteobacteria bacterium]